MNGIFMFGHDPFGPNENYWVTYQRLGGSLLDRSSVLQAVRVAFYAITQDYERPELFRMNRVFAAHEIGFVPAEHENFLRTVAETHHLGIVSNICATAEPWLLKLREVGLLELFRIVVFSSCGRDIKPSPLMFQRGLLGLPPDASVVFVGDSLERDIIPAKALGLATAWIAPFGSSHPVVSQLPELTEA